MNVGRNEGDHEKKVSSLKRTIKSEIAKDERSQTMKNLTVTLLAIVVALTMSSAVYAQCGSTEKASATGSAKENARVVEKMDIVETAMSAGSFETLVTAVKTAGLVEALKGEGPLTVFAPTDEAFASLPEGALESLMKDKEALAAVLTYHVVPRELKAADVVKLSKVESLNGQDIEVRIDDKKVLVAEAEVKSTDILCSNGVIHVIDRVILPEMGE
jgi:uncharacterized surface protein with fasciclin (FAS1) repeats